MDINKIILTGVAETRPVLSTLPQSGTPICSFTVRVDERFINNKSHVSTRPNFFRIESLGKQARVTYDKVQAGSRYLIDGYLRQENSSSDHIDIVKIRSFGVIPDQTMEAHHYKRGLATAVSILAKSRSIDEALKVLKELASDTI